LNLFTFTQLIKVMKCEQLQEARLALAELDRTIALNPQDAQAYFKRGVLKHEKLDDFQGALIDFAEAIAINPKHALAYIERGVLKYKKLNNSRGALIDFDKAIAINPNYALAYIIRAVLKHEKLDDFQGALADYDRAIALNSQFAQAYFLRGVVKSGKLGDRSGGIDDLRQAVKLSQAQGDNDTLQCSLEALQHLDKGESASDGTYELLTSQARDFAFHYSMFSDIRSRYQLSEVMDLARNLCLSGNSEACKAVKIINDITAEAEYRRITLSIPKPIY
jgi:tetratricopeptide (TPR) repeat protein